MRKVRSMRLRRAPAALGWGMAAFLALRLVSLALESRYPRVYDEEYACRLDLLRAWQKEGPHRPLCLLVGSSRTMMSFRPEVLPPMPTPAGEQPLAFNFSHSGAGPVFNWMMVNRLLHQGIRPRWLVVEIMPAYLTHDGDNYLMLFMGADDLPLLRHYQSPFKLYRKYAWKRLGLAREYQAEFLRRQVPDLDLAPGSAFPYELGPLGGMVRLDEEMSPAERARHTAIAQRQYQDMLQNFHITRSADRAIQEVVQTCRREEIDLTFVVTPEGSTLQSWYPPAARAEIDVYLRDLRERDGVRVVDARGWLADSDFFDEHHVLLRGANAFTARLGRELLQPLAAGGLKTP